jgi:hypothetical protein
MTALLLLTICYFAFAVFVGKVIALGNRQLMPPVLAFYVAGIGKTFGRVVPNGAAAMRHGRGGSAA